MTGSGFDARELGELSADLRRMAASVQPRAATVVRKTSLDLVAGAKQRTPVDTGFLRSSNSATISADGLAADVGPTATYARFVHDGTSRVAPRPFLKEALREVAPGFEAAMGQLLEEGL